MENSEEKLFKRIESEKEKRSKILESKNQKTEPNLLGIGEAVDAYYLLNKIKLYCEYLSYKLVVGEITVGYDRSAFFLLDESLLKIEKDYLETFQIFKIYWNIKNLYENFEKDQHALFFELIELINENAAEMKVDEVSELFSYLSNFCIKKINTGTDEYLKNLLVINLKMIDSLYSEKDSKKLPPSIFKNMVNNALRIKDTSFFADLELTGLEPEEHERGFRDGIEWTEKFISKYSKHLDKKNELVYHNYCQAILEFERSDFEMAHILLKKLQRKRGFFINLNIKKIYIKVQIERFNLPKKRSDAFNELEKSLEAYRGLIRYEKQKQQINYQLKLHEGFYQFCQKLFNLYCKQNGIYYKNASYKQQKIQLREEVVELNPPYKVWLVDKIDLLK